MVLYRLVAVIVTCVLQCVRGRRERMWRRGVGSKLAKVWVVDVS